MACYTTLHQLHWIPFPPTPPCEAQRKSGADPPKTRAAQTTKETTKETTNPLGEALNMPDKIRNCNPADTIACADPIGFLQHLDPTGAHNLVAIDPITNVVIGRTFAPGAWDQMQAFVDTHAARNVYFSVNEPAQGAPNTKLKKEHIARVRAIFVDADPRKSAPFDEERQRLAKLADAARRSPCPPTYVVDSGGGYQFFWQLAEKLPAADAANAKWAEEQGRGLAFAIGGDPIQNVDRIMRLPGTTNHPDEKKRSRGRAAAPARMISAELGRTYREADLRAYAPPRAPGEAEDCSEEIATLQRSIDMIAVAAGPSEATRANLQRAAAHDPRLAEILAGKPLRGDDQSGSAYRAALVARLCTAGLFTPIEYAQIATTLPHCNTDKQTPEGWPRQFAREWCNIGVKHQVEHWFTPLEDDEENLNPFEAQARAAMRDPANQADPDRFKFISLDHAAELALTHSTKPLIKGLLDQGAMTVLYGDSNIGKTFVALTLAFHISDGRKFANLKTNQFDVLYVALEGGVGILKRSKAVYDHFAPTNPERFHLLREPINLSDPDADLPHLLAALGRLPQIGLIVIDTASRALAGGDENSSVDMGAFVRNLDLLRRATSAHILVIHHTGKDKAKGARGHSLLRAATDTEIEVDEGVIRVTKQRDLEKNWSSGFKLVDVPLGINAEGDVMTSAVVELVEEQATRVVHGLALPAKQKRLLDALRVLHSGAEGGEAERGWGAQTIDDLACRMDGGTPDRKGVYIQLKRLIESGTVKKTPEGRYLYVGCSVFD